MKTVLMTLVALTTLAFLTGSAHAGADSLQLLFHGNTQGKIDDCGCKTNPLGGIAQRAAHIQSARREGPVVLVDAGNLFGKATEDGRRQTDFLVQETRGLDYDAIGVGVWDLNYGVDYLAAQDLPFTSANLRIDGDLALPAYRVVKRDGVRIGFVSVMDPMMPATELAKHDGVTIDPIESALEAVLPQVQQKVDVLVLLATLPRAQLKAYLAANPGTWDAAIDGASTNHFSAPKQLSETSLLAANNRGKYLGSVAMTKDGLGESYELIAIKPRGAGPSDDAIAGRVEEFLASSKQMAASSR